MIKKFFFMLVFIGLSSLVFCEEGRDSELDKSSFVFVLGPRAGGAYVQMNPQAFSDEISEVFGEGTYYPGFSVMGIAAKQRVLLGAPGHHLSVQQILLLGGIEQAFVIPSLSFLLGYHHSSGLEFGVGPIFAATGIGMVGAVGVAFDLGRGVKVPINLSVNFPNKSQHWTFALTTGFDFVVSSSR